MVFITATGRVFDASAAHELSDLTAFSQSAILRLIGSIVYGSPIYSSLRGACSITARTIAAGLALAVSMFSVEERDT